jgi:acetyl-CoA carboxylase alpha subunit
MHRVQSHWTQALRLHNVDRFRMPVVMSIVTAGVKPPAAAIPVSYVKAIGPIMDGRFVDNMGFTASLA